VQTLTIKLKPEQDAWLKRQAKALKRSKGSVIRDLIHQQQTRPNGSLGQALADLRGCLKGSKELSTRRLKGYGRS
jgi:predicted transcriptional regulator